MGRLLGIDYGTKKIGLAITDELRMIASPFEVQPNDSKFWIYMETIIKNYHIDGFVVGTPLHDGENSFLSQVMVFIKTLHTKFSFPIYLQDESLSSKDSRSFLIASGKRGKKLKQDLDKYAAQAILHDFLLSLERGIITEYQPEDLDETI
ncbi:MAG: Holliday junction resolvase RuvX [Brevinema sp.]